MKLSRRQFTAGSAAMLGSGSLLAAGPALANRNDQLNILCWEGYNTEDVLGPFRNAHPGATVRAESGTSDPDMINKLRAGETRVWDLINVNQPWARDQLYPENLIIPLDQDRFLPHFDNMLPEFAKPYPLAFADDGNLIGMPQRYGPFSFVVNTDKISQDTAETEGWDLFLNDDMKDRYGILAYDNWNVIHMAMTAGMDPFKPIEGEENLERFRAMAQRIFDGSRMMSDDLTTMNTALINGEIDAYFTGGIYSCSPARYDGMLNVRSITPKTGPVDGKGGLIWVELTSAVNNPDPTSLAMDFLEFVQTPDIAKAVAFAEGTYNAVVQMGNPEVMNKFTPDELEAIQLDSLAEDIERSSDFRVVPSYDVLLDIYTQVRRS